MARIVLIGAGRMGYRFAQAIRQAGHDLIAIFDPAPIPFAIDAEPALADIHVTDYDSIASAEADVFVIATTADHHIDMALRLLAAGHRRLIIEKPLSQSVSDAITLRDDAERLGARIVVNHGRRYDANTAALKALDGSAETGALRVVAIRMGGGALGCVGTHWIDLCNNLLGGIPEKVYAELSEETPENTRGVRFDDPGGTVLMRYADGRRASLDMGDDVGIVVGADFIFERGLVSWQSEGGNWTYRHRRAEDAARPLALYGLPLIDGDFSSSPPDLIAYAKATIADVLGDGAVISGLNQAIDTMEVYAAIRAAAKRETPVRLPLAEADREIRYAIP